MQKDFIEFVKKYPLRSFEKNELLMGGGKSTENVYIIRDGYAKVYAAGVSGNEQLIWLAGRYDLVPAERLFSRRVDVIFFYKAMSDLSAYELPKKELVDYAQQKPHVMEEIARSLSNHYDDLMLRLRSVEQSTVRDKLIHTLHYIATRFSAEEVVALHEIGLQLTHQDIGQMVGATRETTAIELKKLKNEGMIDYTRQEFYIYVDKLAAFI